MPQYPTGTLDACLAHLTDSFVIYQALANPKKSQELTEFVKDIVHTETSALMREHNDVQRDEISMLQAEISRLQRERMDHINAHAAEVQALHGEYTLKLRASAGV